MGCQYCRGKKKSWGKTFKTLLKISFALAALFLLLYMLQQLEHLKLGIAAIEHTQQKHTGFLNGIHNQQEALQHQVHNLKVKINGIEVKADHQTQPSVQHDHGTNHHLNPQHLEQKSLIPTLIGMGAMAGSLLWKGFRMLSPVMP